MLLNAVLAIVVVYGGVQFRNEYKAAKAREAALRRARISPAPAPPFAPLPSDPPVLPSGYKDVAMKFLFHPSRNPDVPVELPPPPPPPPPMPDLPRVHGQMNLGDGPTALLVEKPGMPEKAIKPGESIGQFKYPLFAESETHFFFKDVEAEIEFPANAKGEFAQLVLHRGSVHETATRK